MKHEDTHKYDDIIHLPHPVSKRHPQMSAINRAAQFSPFAALTGYDAAIRETARQTEDFAELDESRKEELDWQLRLLSEHLSEHPEITVTFFRPDTRKNGGAYVTVCGRIQKIDSYRRELLLSDGSAVPIEYLYAIESGLF